MLKTESLTTLNVRRSYKEKLKELARKNRRTIQGELSIALDGYFLSLKSPLADLSQVPEVPR